MPCPALLRFRGLFLPCQAGAKFCEFALQLRGETSEILAARLLHRELLLGLCQGVMQLLQLLLKLHGFFLELRRLFPRIGQFRL
ncbi:MAG: hypothetical protein FJX77_11325, partial [Armatimonadetes bacterium]|nr:hypothetical protein [Armatimonadota bacterium]